MNHITYRISLDLRKTDSGVVVKVKRDDTVKKLAISLTDGGKPYHITEDCSAVFAGEKPDGTILCNPCSIEDCVVTYEITPQTIADLGEVKSEIRLYSTDGNLATSPSFTILVVPPVYDDDRVIESHDEVNALTELITSSSGAIQKGEEVVRRGNAIIAGLQNIGSAAKDENVLVTPQMFGAKGDGATDDTAALRIAFDYAAAIGKRCFIPRGTYVISPTKQSDGYTYCFALESNLHIEGCAGREGAILKVVTDERSYTSIFSNVRSAVKNVTIENIVIEQDHTAASDELRNAGVSNMKCAVHASRKCEDVTLHNIHFKNCCGVNTVIFGEPSSNNITISSCRFDYEMTENVDWYDRSVIYLNCNNYLVENNTVNGNFECLGGIEMHGYNGTARGNLVEKCYTAINVAMDYDTSKNVAGIFISENRLENNARGIHIWGNYRNEKSGVAGITINSNVILTDGEELAKMFNNFDGTGAVNKTLSGIETNEGVTTAYKDLKILNNSIIFRNTLFSRDPQALPDKRKNFLSIVSSGIGVWADADIEGITISQNYVEGSFGNGIKIGLRSNGTDKTIKNVVVTDNVLKDCGRAADGNAQYMAYILLGHGNKERVVFSGNILEKTDADFNVWSAFYNWSSEKYAHKDVYFTKDNKITFVNQFEMAITNADGANVIYDEGENAQRPTIARDGHLFYDTTLKEMLLKSNGSWTPVGVEIPTEGGVEPEWEEVVTHTIEAETTTWSYTFEETDEILVTANGLKCNISNKSIDMCVNDNGLSVGERCVTTGNKLHTDAGTQMYAHAKAIDDGLFKFEHYEYGGAAACAWNGGTGFHRVNSTTRKISKFFIAATGYASNKLTAGTITIKRRVN